MRVSHGSSHAPCAARRRVSAVRADFLAGPGSRDASAQQFGRNKVEYVDFDFKVLDTEHFAVYYYSSEEASARLAARLAERWYARLSRVLGHSLSEPAAADPLRQPA